ncbi:MAG: T9SS type A sorting domain-containing protein [bacterium]
MKGISILCRIMLCWSWCPTVLAQNETLFHYPLNDGDLWEYWEGPRFFIYEQRKVIGDSLLPNGKLYKTIEIQGNLQSRALKFQRLEEHSVFEYAPRFVPPDSIAHDEVLLFELEVHVSHTWPYQGYGYQGFLSDSGFYQVNEIGFMNFGNHAWHKMGVGSYTLPNYGLWFNPDAVLLDSIGLYGDTYEGGYFELRGAIINGRQFGTITAVNERDDSDQAFIPTSLVYFRNYPNPVVSEVKIELMLRHPDKIRISIVDLLGRQIYVFPFADFSVGVHSLHWNAKDFLTAKLAPVGTYFLVLTNNASQHLTRKFMIVK